MGVIDRGGAVAEMVLEMLGSQLGDRGALQIDEGAGGVADKSASRKR